MDGHHHDHGSTAGRHRGRLLVVLVLTTCVMVAEVLAAFFTGSLALAADAGHMFTDAAGIAIALIAMTIADRATSARSTFGLYRLEIFAAAVNAIVLFAVAAWVIYSAVRRLGDPPEVDAGPMLVVAVVGLLANAFSLWWLRAGQRESLNMRGAYLEVLADLLGSLAVVVAAAVIWVTGQYIADPIISLAVAVFIVPRTWMLLTEVVTILLESTPKGIDLEHVRRHITDVAGVVGVHDLHVWTISSRQPVMSAHVVVSDDWLKRSGEVLDQLQVCLGEHFDVAHSTFQIEPVGHQDHEHPTHA